MTGEQYKSVVVFDQALTIGMQVTARWTNSHRSYHAPAEVIKLNKKTLNVKLLDSIKGYYAGNVQELYPVGHVIQLPRITDIHAWTANNRAEPLGGF